MYEVIVESSNIKSFSYDPDTEVLTVVFHRGGTYAYKKVPIETATAMVAADSTGQFFYKSIREKFETEKLA